MIDEAEDAARLAIQLRAEVDMLRRFAEMATGAHRFARWRIWLAAMQRKRAEHRAAAAYMARTALGARLEPKGMGGKRDPIASTWMTRRTRYG